MKDQKPSPPDKPMGIRPAGPDDVPFITDSWARSYLHSTAVRSVPSDVYKIEQRARITRLLARSVCLCLTAPDDASYISGFIVMEAPKNAVSLAIVHYVLVHANLQGNGFGSKLVNLARSMANDPSDPMWATHWTIPMKNVAPSWNLIFNPYLLEVNK